MSPYPVYTLASLDFTSLNSASGLHQCMAQPELMDTSSVLFVPLSINSIEDYIIIIVCLWHKVSIMIHNCVPGVKLTYLQTPVVGFSPKVSGNLYLSECLSSINSILYGMPIAVIKVAAWCKMAVMIQTRYKIWRTMHWSKWISYLKWLYYSPHMQCQDQYHTRRAQNVHSQFLVCTIYHTC